MDKFESRYPLETTLIDKLDPELLDLDVFDDSITSDDVKNLLIPTLELMKPNQTLEKRNLITTIINNLDNEFKYDVSTASDYSGRQSDISNCSSCSSDWYTCPRCYLVISNYSGNKARHRKSKGCKFMETNQLRYVEPRESDNNDTIYCVLCDCEFHKRFKRRHCKTNKHNKL